MVSISDLCAPSRGIPVRGPFFFLFCLDPFHKKGPFQCFSDGTSLFILEDMGGRLGWPTPCTYIHIYIYIYIYIYIHRRKIIDAGTSVWTTSPQGQTGAERIHVT